MSTSAITGSLLSQIAGSSSTADQFVTDLNQVFVDLESGNLAAAQEDYVTLSSDAQNGATASTADTSASGITASLLTEIESSSSNSSSFVNELNQLGTDLGNGDLTSAQGDMMALQSTALSAASSAGDSSGASSSSSSSSTPASQAEITELVKAIVQAMEAGDNSAVSSAMSQLASVSPSAQGGSILEQESENFGAGSSTPSSSNGISQIVQSMLMDSATDSVGVDELA